MGRLANKIAVVTGAAQGIGKAIVDLYVAEGAHVIAVDLNDELLQQQFDEHGDRVICYSFDVSDHDAWAQFSQSIQAEFEHIDILVNNAGITGFSDAFGENIDPHDPEHVSPENWHKVMGVNIDGTAWGCKHMLPLLKNSKAASIVNMSSRSGMVGIPGAAAYAASKAAIRNHSKTVALYCAQHGYPIRCNSIHPGAILTPMWEAMLGPKEQHDQAISAVSAGIPLGHMGEPNDVAYAAVYFGSDESKYITGAELTIDGGILAGSAASPKHDD
ncbi:SDR family NAD(P)-dependent oxidoreductase [Pseudidiomarina taiwanensis]|uniref:Short-chain dehydrogenase n=1 Tax=Pseudidiomarina taiwanensis TaxID=337250 RepID=A0A432ZMX9_9GAMM|nr:SDR family oxidoreductase [Pseudidiomarina taiwanensis]RUO79230.1 short-chain dehydrogenase [Pseudidiomarina taiwanensis]